MVCEAEVLIHMQYHPPSPDSPLSRLKCMNRADGPSLPLAGVMSGKEKLLLLHTVHHQFSCILRLRVLLHSCLLRRFHKTKPAEAQFKWRESLWRDNEEVPFDIPAINILAALRNLRGLTVSVPFQAPVYWKDNA